MTIPVGNSKYGNECAICLLDFKKNSRCLAIGCGHVFHKKCFDDYHKINHVTKKCFLCQHPVYYQSPPVWDKLRPAAKFSMHSFTVLFCFAWVFKVGNKLLYWKNHYQNEGSNTSPAPWRRKAYVPDHIVLITFAVIFLAITIFKIGKCLIDHQNLVKGRSQEIRYAKKIS